MHASVLKTANSALDVNLFEFNNNELLFLGYIFIQLFNYECLVGFLPTEITQWLR